MAKRKLPLTTIIGAGSVGSCLAYALYEKGYPIVSVISKRRSSAKSLARGIQCKRYSDVISDIHPETKLIVIAVSDNALSKVAQELSIVETIDVKKLLVVHTSGLHSSHILEPLKLKGAAVAAFHPIQTFPKLIRRNCPSGLFNGIFFGVDCAAKVFPKIERLAHDIGSNIISIPESLRPLYHIACVFASSFVIAQLNVVSELSRSLQLSQPWNTIFQPLITSALNNAMENSPQLALTGPVLRNDLRTLKLHVTTLIQNAPEVLPLYIANTLEVAQAAKHGHRISQKQFDTISSTLYQSQTELL